MPAPRPRALPHAANPPLQPVRAPRLPHWPERLAAYLESARHTPFAWGSHDCGTFAGGCVLALTGANPLRALGTWRSQLAAARVIQRHGGLPALVAQLLPPRASAAFGQRGDVVCVDLAGQPTLGVLAGNGLWAAPGPDGLIWRPAAEVQHVYTVG